MEDLKDQKKKNDIQHESKLDKDLNFLAACQSVKGYSMTRAKEIMFIVRLYLYYVCIFSYMFLGTQLYDIKYFYLIQIICTHWYGSSIPK